jgi:hypothetical protein
MMAYDQRSIVKRSRQYRPAAIVGTCQYMYLLSQASLSCAFASATLKQMGISSLTNIIAAHDVEHVFDRLVHRNSIAMLKSPGVVSDPSHFTIEMTLELDYFYSLSRILILVLKSKKACRSKVQIYLYLIRFQQLAVSNLGTIVLTTEIAVHKLNVFQHPPQVSLAWCPVLKGLETQNCAGVLPFLPSTGSSIVDNRERNLNVTSRFLAAFRHEPSDQKTSRNNDRPEKPSTS